MACVAVPLCTTSAAAAAYGFPFESITETTVAVESFHPTTTTFRFPAVCASVYTTATVVCGLCGVAELLWTNEIEACACAVNPIKTRKQAPRVRPSKIREVGSLQRHRHEGIESPSENCCLLGFVSPANEQAPPRVWQHCGFQNNFIGNLLSALDLGGPDAEASRGRVPLLWRVWVRCFHE